MRYARALGYARALRYLLPHCSDTIEILRPRCAASCTRLTRNTHTDTQQETRDTVRKREEKQGNTRKHEVQYRRARADAQGYRGRVVKTYSSKDIPWPGSKIQPVPSQLIGASSGRDRSSRCVASRPGASPLLCSPTCPAHTHMRARTHTRRCALHTSVYITYAQILEYCRT